MYSNWVLTDFYVYKNKYYLDSSKPFYLVFYGIDSRRKDPKDPANIVERIIYFDSAFECISFILNLKNGIELLLNSIKKQNFFSIKKISRNNYKLIFSELEFGDTIPKLDLSYSDLKECINVYTDRYSLSLFSNIPKDAIYEMDQIPNKFDNKYHIKVFYTTPPSFNSLLDCFKHLLSYKNGEKIVLDNLPKE